MVVEHQKFNLFKKPAFEKAIMIPPVTIPSQMQNDACFYYVLDGEQRAVGPIETKQMSKNEGVLMKCGNYFAQLTGDGESGQFEAIAVHFYPEILKKIYETGMPDFLKEPKTALPKSNMAIVKGNILIKKYIDSLVFYFENPELVNDELLILKLKELILLLSKTENAPKVYDILTHLFSPQTFEFKEIIQANLYSDLSVEQLAFLAGMSLSSFKREFKKVFDSSPAVYCKKKKLEKAAQLLLTTNLQVSYIAYDSGFNDLAHFSKCFKQEYGVSPSNYKLNQTDKSLS